MICTAGAVIGPFQPTLLLCDDHSKCISVGRLASMRRWRLSRRTSAPSLLQLGHITRLAGIATQVSALMVIWCAVLFMQQQLLDGDRLLMNNVATSRRVMGAATFLHGKPALCPISWLPCAAVMEAATLLEDAAEDELAMRQHELDAAEELALEAL